MKLLELVMICKGSIQNKEGWVIQFDDGQMAKVKTDWYFTLHGLVDENTRENLLIKNILNEEVDDLLSIIPNPSEKRDFIVYIMDIVDHHFNHNINVMVDLINKFKESGLSRKEYAAKHYDYKYFGVLMRFIESDIIDRERLSDSLKQAILKETFRLNTARAFLESIK